MTVLHESSDHAHVLYIVHKEDATEQYAITTHDSKVCHFWVTLEDLPLSDHLLLCK